MNGASPKKRINYDEVAATHDRRFIIGGRQEVAAAFQLAVLSDDAYAAGVARIEAALAADKEIAFPVDISLAMVTDWIERRGDVKAA